MRITELRPTLWTENLDATLAFYTQTLGFNADEVNRESGWASLSLDNVSIMLARPNAHEPYEKIGFTGSFYFNTDNVDAAWEKVKGTAKICYGLENFPYGMREFAIYDNNGYILQFGQPLTENE